MSDERETEQDQHEVATEDSDGNLEIDIEDAGGREIRDVDEEPPQEEIEEIEEERERRLDPDNRPDGAEVDNTGRTFDSETGMFTDNPEHDDAEAQFAPDAEPEAATSSSTDSDDSGDTDESDDSGSTDDSASTDQDDHAQSTDQDTDAQPTEQDDDPEGDDDAAPADAVPAESDGPAAPGKHRA